MNGWIPSMQARNCCEALHRRRASRGWVKPSWLVAIFAAFISLEAESSPAPSHKIFPHDPLVLSQLTTRLSSAVVTINSYYFEVKTNSDQDPLVYNVSQKFASKKPAPRTLPHAPFGNLIAKSKPRNSETLFTQGSGFIIHPTGLVVTNYHVIAKADLIRLTLSNNKTVTAELIGKDPRSDIAILRINQKQRFAYARFGKSQQMRTGDRVMAIGNPMGLGNSISMGIISEVSRKITGASGEYYIQTDASLNEGNSGGPLFNAKGEVIGINNQIFVNNSGDNDGIGFAIPSDFASSIVSQLISHGKVQRGWLGLRLQTLDSDLASQFGIDRMAVMVAATVKDSAAGAAGVLAGDVILALNDKPYANEESLHRAIMNLKVGSQAKLTIWRNHQTQTLLTKVELRDDSSFDETIFEE